MKSMLYLIIILAAYTLQAQTTITILHTNNINGTLENCLCADHPLGSIEKIKPVVDSLRAENPNLLFVDTGDFFSAFGERAKDELSIKAMHVLGFDLLVPGDQEFSNGIDFFKNQIAAQNKAYLSANLKLNGGPSFPAFKIFQLGGVHVLLTSVTDPDVFRFYDEAILREMQISDPIAALEKVIQENKSDYVIVLSHSGLEKDQALAQKIPGIGLIIGGHSQDVLRAAQDVNQTKIIQAGSDGYYLGRVQLIFDKQKILLTFKSELVPMRIELSNDPQLADLAREWDLTFITSHLNKDKQFHVLQSNFVVSAADRCRPCHQEKFKNWQHSAHANSWQSIRQKKRTKAQQCIACHVSGYGRKEGFINENLTPGLQQINCSDCHWTEREHFANKKPESIRPITDKTCTRCHDPKNDPDFNYKEAIRRIGHK